ncbi:MAG TPA: DsbA family protein [Haliangiales bacterium]|nr:DsbA family protein [Haliangiales bacterium]
MEPVRFHFDFISPYSYVAWTQVHALGARIGRAIEPVPFLLGAVLKAVGSPTPAFIPPKARYILKDCARKARAAGVPFEPPSPFPFNSLLALRVASLDLEPEPRRALIDRLYRFAWGGGPSLGERSTVARAVAEVGLPGSLVADAEGDAAKVRVRARTDAAIAAGAFGSPTLFVDGELFFGLDSYPAIERFVAGDDVPRETFARWGVA